MNYAVAVDGPAGSGKSTIAKLIAKDMGLVYIDTGAMYRTVGLYCIKNGINTKNSEDVKKVIKNIDMQIKLSEGNQKIFLSGEDVTDEIRSAKAGLAASDVGAIGEVRKKLVRMQQKMAEGTSVIMDGRDIGTNVLPNALVKIFLVASVEVRAERRCGELEKLGKPFDFDTIKKQLAERDKNDSTRKLNPLRKAGDAVEVDTTFLNIDEVKEKVEKIIKAKIRGGKDENNSR
ncbi:MAG: (d)CMP kinase [Clostridia bacterium]|jgi:cytidylate kinase|nr:(d)CMP kinase [Clostridia bacterium]MCI1999117.1 (d)CMP kinase [Clostridia bacterium]MCI2013867.1 (d)CMP kinase [Clostridia bacterium]